MTENQANEILKKVGKRLFDAFEKVNAISVVKLGNEEFNLKIIASPTAANYDYDNNLGFQEEFKNLSEKISIYLQDKDFNLSRENFPDNRLPDVIFKDEKLFYFKKPVKFLSPDPCEFCDAPENFSLGLIIKRANPIGKCFILFSAHSVVGLRNTFFAKRRLMLDENIPVDNIVTISDQAHYDLVIAESEFNPFMEQITSIGQASYEDIIRHYGCSSGIQSNGVVKSLNASNRIGDNLIENLIELEINSRQGDSGAPVLNEKDQTIGLLHSTIDSGQGTDITYCTNLYQVKEKHLLDPYYEDNCFYLATR